MTLECNNSDAPNIKRDTYCKDRATDPFLMSPGCLYLIPCSCPHFASNCKKRHATSACPLSIITGPLSLHNFSPISRHSTPILQNHITYYKKLEFAFQPCFKPQIGILPLFSLLLRPLHRIEGDELVLRPDDVHFCRVDRALGNTDFHGDAGGRIGPGSGVCLD